MDNKTVEFCNCLYTLKKMRVDEEPNLVVLPETLRTIRVLLNQMYPDYNCKEVKYNLDEDKEFFGLFLKPMGIVPNELINKLFAGLSSHGNASFEVFSFNSYAIEIDSRVFARYDCEEVMKFIQLSVTNLCHPNTVYGIRNLIDYYIALNNVHIEVDRIIKYAPVFELVMDITIHNMNNVFTEELEGLEANIGINDIGDKRTAMLSWYLTHYDGFDYDRNTQYMLRNAMECESSRLVKGLCYSALQCLSNLAYNDERYYTSLSESTKRKGLLYQMKRNGLKSIEEDLFEYTMRLRNVETQDEALLLMRQINSRMSILEDYLREENIDEADRKRWTKCYEDYLKLREQLSKKTVYNRKMYGLFVDYNALDDTERAALGLGPSYY